MVRVVRIHTVIHLRIMVEEGRGRGRGSPEKDSHAGSLVVDDMRGNAEGMSGKEWGGEVQWKG